MAVDVVKTPRVFPAGCDVISTHLGPYSQGLPIFLDVLDVDIHGRDKIDGRVTANRISMPVCNDLWLFKDRSNMKFYSKDNFCSPVAKLNPSGQSLLNLEGLFTVLSSSFTHLTTLTLSL